MPRPGAHLPDTQIAPHVVQEAIAWFVELNSGAAGDDVRIAWQRWRSQNPEHERAWQRIETFNQRLPDMSASTAVSALAPARGRTRRNALKAMALFVTGGGALWLVQESEPWQELRASYRTATGEQRKFVLPDGSQLLLNTDSAAELAYTDTQRYVRLLRGEALFTTAPDPARRPFAVITQEGEARALGTKFVVRQLSDSTRVAVIAHAVDVYPARASAIPLRIDTGSMLEFNAEGAMHWQTLGDAATAWSEGVIAAIDMPLGDFVAELSRYREGWLACDPAVAKLRLSGVYPLTDTDAILVALERSLPVKVSRNTRYWTRIVSR